MVLTFLLNLHLMLLFLVNLWHGMPIKAIGFLDKKQDFCYSDFTLATSKNIKKLCPKFWYA